MTQAAPAPQRESSSQNIVTRVLGWIFAIDRNGAIVRRAALWVGLFLLWTGLVGVIHPFSLGELAPMGRLIPLFVRFGLANYAPYSLLLEPFANLAAHYFYPTVFRHIFVLALMFWVARRTAAIYLDDVYELENVSTAARFITQAVFGGRYNRITIRDGQINPPDKTSPVYLIGGPGLVNVHLENAALFEKAAGTPHVIGPNPAAAERGLRRFTPLEGFERLREVIDLRDLVVYLDEVKARTKDGIEVAARDVKAIYSVYRGNPAEPATADPLHQPYPFTAKAIQNLVYIRGKLWKIAAKIALEGEIQTFIRSHTLNEFLANLPPQDLAALQQPQTQAAGQTTRLTPTQGSGMNPEFIPRSQMTEDFYAFTRGHPDRAEGRGFDFHWIGVGTWATPAVIPKKHQEAWTQTIQNRIEGSEWALNQIRRESRIQELLRLINDVPITAFGTGLNQEKPPDEIKRELMLAYREKLRNAVEFYRKNGQLPPQELTATLSHLDHL